MFTFSFLWFAVTFSGLPLLFHSGTAELKGSWTEASPHNISVETLTSMSVH